MSVKTVAVISEKRDEHVSGSRLAEEIQQACNELEANGYAISTVFPLLPVVAVSKMGSDMVMGTHIPPA